MDTFIIHPLLKNASDERGTGRISADELAVPALTLYPQIQRFRSKFNVISAKFLAVAAVPDTRGNSSAIAFYPD
jgi:hypothetical protein